MRDKGSVFVCVNVFPVVRLQDADLVAVALDEEPAHRDIMQAIPKIAKSVLRHAMTGIVTRNVSMEPWIDACPPSVLEVLDRVIRTVGQRSTDQRSQRGTLIEHLLEVRRPFRIHAYIISWIRNHVNPVREQKLRRPTRTRDGGHEDTAAALWRIGRL